MLYKNYPRVHDSNKKANLPQQFLIICLIHCSLPEQDFWVKTVDDWMSFQASVHLPENLGQSSDWNNT